MQVTVAIVFVLMSMVVVAVADRPGMEGHGQADQHGQEHELDFSHVIVSSDDHTRVYHASLDLLSGALGGALPGRFEGDKTPFDIESRDPDELKVGPIEDVHRKIFADIREQPTIHDAVAKSKSDFNIRHHPTEFGINLESTSVPRRAMDGNTLRAIIEKHGVAHLMGEATEISTQMHHRLQVVHEGSNGTLTNITLPKASVGYSRIMGSSPNVISHRETLPDNAQSNLQNNPLGHYAHLPIRGNTRNRVDIGESMMSQTLTTTGVQLFTQELTQRTLRIVMEEKHVRPVRDPHGKDIGAATHSTFFIMPILKLIIAPFVCLIMMVVIGPAEGGLKNAGGGAITEAAGGPLVKMLGMIIGFIFGLLLAYVMGGVVTEATTFMLVGQLTFIIVNNVFEQTAMDSANNLQHFFMNTLLPALQLETVGYLIDVLSDALSSSLHHTLTRSVSTRLAKSLTPATLHYYYCIYCYYYGDYCHQCFHANEHDIIDQLSWTNFGS